MYTKDGFVKTEVVPNSYLDGYVNHHTCRVCGAEWGTTNNNTIDDCPCNGVLIKEWDGERSIVHVAVDGDTVHMTYPDGVVHVVARTYFDGVNMSYHFPVL